MMRGASILRRGAPWLVGAVLHAQAFAQLPPANPPAAAAAPAPPPQPAPAATVGARFIESCNEALERGLTAYTYLSDEPLE